MRQAAPLPRRIAAAVLAVPAATSLAVMTALAVPAQAQEGPPGADRPARYQGHGSSRHNIRLVGHVPLQARSAYQPLTKRNPINREWYTYVGHHAGEARNPLTRRVEPNGTSIVRVTNPRRPVQVAHIPATGAGQEQAQMVRVCNGRELPSADDGKVYLLRSNGNVSHEIWDVTNPRRSRLLNTVVGALNGTHKNYWDCRSGLGYIVGGAPGWRTERMTMLFDLSNPERPVFIRNFGLPGQEPGSTGPVPTEVHGGIQVGNRFYNGYGTSAGGVFQILDVGRLRTGAAEPTIPNLLFPQVARMNLPRFMGAHTTFPVLNMPVRDDRDLFWDTRDIVVISNESTANECREAHQQVFLVDVTDELNPMGISGYKVRESEGNYCTRGGRFGAHSSNENMTDDFYRKIVFIAYFNAGVRAVDIRNPFRPREVGRYIPATTRNTVERCLDLNGDEVEDRCKTAIQTNNLDTDDRNYIYAVDRNYIYAVDRANTGLHILQVTGEARRIMQQRVRRNPRDKTPTFEEIEGE